MAKSYLISTLVDYHSIFHVITSIRNDSNDGVGTMGVLPEIILFITLSANQRLLREKNSIDFVIHTERMIVVGCSHCLFSHLALIHVTRRLIVFWERLHSCDDTQYVNRIKFLMSCVTPYVLLLTGDRHI